MPLSETNKAQSQSIEDLIAQLDNTGSNNNTSPTNHHKQSNNTNTTSNTINNTFSNNKNSLNSKQTNDLTPAQRQQMQQEQQRRLIKGKRTKSTSLSVNHQKPSGGAVSFAKQTSFGQNSEPLLAKNIIMSKKYSKHTKGALAGKKAGGGGKHTWGAPGCELTSLDVIDSRDPNYDSAEEGVVMVCVENGSDSGNRSSGRRGDNEDDEDERYPPLKDLDADDLQQEIRPVILEYFHNGDTIEVTDHIMCYNFSKCKHQLIAYALQLSLEQNNTSKELMSRLLRDFTRELFTEKDFVLAFNMVLRNLNDLTLDNPDAPEKIGTFIARAIADKVLTKSYLDITKDEIENTAGESHRNGELTRQAISSARVLVDMNSYLYQLSHIWGAKGGFLAVKELTDKIHEIIQEYYDSGDIDESIRCLKELNVPHFHHEFIYEALDFLLQKGASEHDIELITSLLCRLCQSVIVTYDQLKIGFTRIFDVLSDISLDVPNASTLMDNILNKCHEKGFLSANISDLAPNRSRKRFVSEGDGGRVKETI